MAPPVSKPRAPLPFDVIVLDMMLPRMDGLTVARRLRDGHNQTPILMLTAKDAAADIVRGLDAGADDYLTKPFAFEILLARLRAVSRAASSPNPCAWNWPTCASIRPRGASHAGRSR